MASTVEGVGKWLARAISSSEIVTSSADDRRAAKPAAPDDPKKDEKYWKGRITAAREAADHDKVLLDALQSRVNALSTDFVNTSDMPCFRTRPSTLVRAAPNAMRNPISRFR